MKVLLNLMTLAMRAGILGIVGATPLTAADEPKAASPPLPTPVENNVKPLPLDSKAMIDSKARLGRVLDKDVADYLAKRGFIIVDPNAPAKHAGANKDASGDSEGLAVTFKTYRQAAYEAERHSAEKIKAHVQAVDELARLLLSGGAPSPVLR
jgi:hypothetical protein